MQNNELRSFRYNTRQRRNNVGTIAMPSGGGNGNPLFLPQIGYLSSVILFVVADISNAGASTAANLAPYSILKRIKLQLNNSSQVLFDVSGYGAFLINSVTRLVGRPDQSANSTVYNFPVGNGNNQTLTFALKIPVGVSNGLNFEAGLINLQAPEIRAQLDVTFASAGTDVGSTTTINSANVYVAYEYYEVPDPRQVLQPALLVHRWQEDQQPIVQVGDNVYTVPNGGRLMRMISMVRLNGSRSDSIDYRQLRLNQSDIVYNDPKRNILARHFELYGQDLPTGVFSLDLAESWDWPNESDMRDFIDTEKVTTIENVISVSSGATLGSNNNQLITIRETLQGVAEG